MRLLGALFFVLLLGACSDSATDTSSLPDSLPSSDTTAAPAPTASPQSVLVSISQDGLSEQGCAWVADSEDERRVGLSNRGSLEGYLGMLFVFETPSRWTFWMEDTLIDLDLVVLIEDGTPLSDDEVSFIPAQVGDGDSELDGTDYVVDQILAMDTCLDSECDIYRPDRPYTVSFEMEQGWLEAQGFDIDAQDPIAVTVSEQTCGSGGAAA